MGIINVTADSFSGDGLATPGRSEAEIVAAALEQARGFVAAGAQILDVGAESSRPAQFYGEHPPVSASDEAALAVPVVAALAAAVRRPRAGQHRHDQGLGGPRGARGRRHASSTTCGRASRDPEHRRRGRRRPARTSC